MSNEPRIVRTPGTCGGRPCIEGHQIRAQEVNQHEHSSAFGMMNSLEREGLVVASRRKCSKRAWRGCAG